MSEFKLGQTVTLSKTPGIWEILAVRHEHLAVRRSTDGTVFIVKPEDCTSVRQHDMSASPATQHDVKEFGYE